mgnify:CR=1 FL=1
MAKKWQVAHVSRWQEGIAALLEKKESSISKVGILYDDVMAAHAPLKDNFIWDAERPERVAESMRELEESGLTELCLRVPIKLATREQILRCHYEAYVDKMLSLEACEEGERLEATAAEYNSVFLNSHSIKAAQISCGAVVTAVERCLSVTEEDRLHAAACVTRPPGHHAEGDCAMGFCIFNNVAVAARHATTSFGLERVLIVDWDVHHGNGCQAIFADDPKVLYFSIHRYVNLALAHTHIHSPTHNTYRWDRGAFYPGVVVERVGADAGSPSYVGEGEGKGFSVNVGWYGEGDYEAPAMGDPEYLLAWETVLLPIASSFKPQLILIAAGFDAARGDPYGFCDVTPIGYARLTSLLLQLGAPVVLALEGGYNVPSIKYSLGACVAALCGANPEELKRHDKEQKVKKEALTSIQSTIEAQAKYWPSLQQ